MEKFEKQIREEWDNVDVNGYIEVIPLRNTIDDKTGCAMLYRIPDGRAVVVVTRDIPSYPYQMTLEGDAEEGETESEAASSGGNITKFKGSYAVHLDLAVSAITSFLETMEFDPTFPWTKFESIDPEYW